LRPNRGADARVRLRRRIARSTPVRLPEVDALSFRASHPHRESSIMGIVYSIRRASGADIARLLAHPEDVASYLHGPELAPNASGAPDVRVGGPFALLKLFWSLSRQPKDAGAMRQAAVAPPLGLPEDDANSVYLDKAWHGLHFLFTGTAWEGEEPACFLVRGGEEIGDEDPDRAPARALGPARTRAFATYLAALTPEELARRYDPARMTTLDIYPDVIWQRAADAGESELPYLLSAFEKLRTFVRSAAAGGDGMIVYGG
jgi:hypothetical protein